MQQVATIERQSHHPEGPASVGAYAVQIRAEGKRVPAPDPEEEALYNQERDSAFFYPLRLHKAAALSFFVSFLFMLMMSCTLRRMQAT